jgi:hypothetical protein
VGPESHRGTRIGTPLFSIEASTSEVRGEGFELPEGSNIVKNASDEILNRNRD